MLSFAFRLFGWADLGRSDVIHSTTTNTRRVLPSLLSVVPGACAVVGMSSSAGPSGVCAEVARSQTLQAGTAGTAGRAYLLGNLGTLATACQANFSRHLVLALVPRLDPSRRITSNYTMGIPRDAGESLHRFHRFAHGAAGGRLQLQWQNDRTTGWQDGRMAGSGLQRGREDGNATDSVSSSPRADPNS